MKKVSICGKGGTGKSVITTLLSNALSEIGYKVLIIDSDESNPGLYRMLGFGKAPKPLIDLLGGYKKVDEIVNRVSLSGGSEELASKELARSLSLQEISIKDIPKEFYVERDNMKLLTVGKITASLEGCACPMGVVSKTFLEKLVLANDEIAIVDMEAGIEHFGRGIENALDTVLIVAEPSFESISLATKINLLASQSGVKEIWAILNKVPTLVIEEKLRDALSKRGIKMIGTLMYSSQISEACLEGRPLIEYGAKETVKKIVTSLF